MSTKRVFVVHNAPTGYIGNRPPAPRTNAAGNDGWVLWADRDKAAPASKVNAAAGGWFDYETGKPLLQVNAAVDDGRWVPWEQRNGGAAPHVNRDSEWQPYVTPEV